MPTSWAAIIRISSCIERPLFCALVGVGAGHEPAPFDLNRRSGQPRLPLRSIARPAIAPVRAKSVLLTSYVLDFADRWLAPLGVTVASPRDEDRLGWHVTLSRPVFAELLEPFW